MNKTLIKITDLFRAKGAEDEKKETETTEGGGDKKEAETTEDGGEEDSGKADDDETKEDGKADETKEEADSVEEVEMTATEFQTLKADAGNWKSNKAELETLRAWQASMKGLGGGLAKDDQSARNGKSAPSIMDKPWNQAALAAVPKGK